MNFADDFNRNAKFIVILGRVIGEASLFAAFQSIPERMDKSLVDLMRAATETRLGQHFVAASATLAGHAA